MKHYKSPAGRIYAYEEDGSQDNIIPSDFVRLSDQELADLRAEQEAAQAETPEQILQEAQRKRDALLVLAALRIDPLQDAVELGEAGEDDAALLLKWKKYRVDVSRIDRQPGFPSAIAWPVEPA